MEEKCVICEGVFYPGALKDGKCKECQKSFPNASTRLEALQQTTPVKQRVTNLNEERVRQIIQEELAKFAQAQYNAKEAAKIQYPTLVSKTANESNTILTSTSPVVKKLVVRRKETE